MSEWKNLFLDTTSLSTDITAPLPNIVDVVNLRDEFNNLVLGTEGETPISRPFILRRMRRDDYDQMIPCSCLDSLTREPDRDYPCPYCQGRGYLWDEELVSAYMMLAAVPTGSNAAVNLPKREMGISYSPAAKFFLPYNINPRIQDRIVELELDVEGTVLIPYHRIAIYELTLVRAMRSDNAKIDFWVANGQTLGPPTRGIVG